MSTNGKKDGIHVVGIDVENLHRLRVARVKLLPGGGLVRVTGKNGSGKSSLLTAIREAFGGAGEVTAHPIHEGADAGHVRIELSNGFTITRRVTEANPKGYLAVIAPDGGKHAQTKLNEWMGANSFDPLAFFSLSADRQTEILFSLGKDPELKSKLKDIRARHASLYAERTPHISEQQRCRRVQKPEGERPEPVDVSAAMAQLRDLQVQDRERSDLERDARSVVDSLARNRTDQDRATVRLNALRAELQSVEAAIETLRTAQEALETEHKARLDQLGEIADVGPEIAAVQARLEQADAVNTSIEPWREWDRAQASLKEATAAAEALTERLGKTKAEELRTIASAGIPVPDLTFDSETCTPLLKGYPLELASGGEQIRMAVAVALAVDPELRVCLVDEANDLDLDALQELDRLAQEHGFQVFGCRIGLEGGGEILVENGEARTPELAEASA